jgi:hypothetical protein
LAVAGLVAATAVAAAQPVAEEAQQPGHHRGEDGGRCLPQLHQPLGRWGLGRRALPAGRTGGGGRTRWRRWAGQRRGTGGLKNRFLRKDELNSIINQENGRKKDVWLIPLFKHTNSYMCKIILCRFPHAKLILIFNHF